MRIYVIASLFLALGFILPVSTSFSSLPEDVDGSGHDLESSGSGSGDWSDKDEITNTKVRPNSEDQTMDITHWPAIDMDSKFVVVANSKSFLENQQIISGIIAGGVTGGILAALLTALLIYKWQKKDDDGYILGRQTHREEIVV